MTDSEREKATIQHGFGHHGTIRIGNFQAVRPRHTMTWDVFHRGVCVETGLTESAARHAMTEES